MNGVPVLQLRGFGVAYGERAVLRDVSMEIAPTGCTVLLGPSGTGKSTLLRTLAGFNRQQPQVRTWGQARYRGQELSGEHHPAMVMQNPRLLVSDVLENLVCEMPQRSSLTRRMQIEVLEQLLAQCGCSHLLDALYAKVVERDVSDQRIIAIIRQVVADPALLMIDEPTAGLKPEQAAKVLDVMQRLGEKRALLVVLHNLREARQLARDVVLLASGCVQEARPVAEFFDAPASECGRHFVQTGSCPEAAESAPPVPPPAPVSAPAAMFDFALASAAPAISAACGPSGFVWLLPGKLAGTPWPGIVHPVRYDLQALKGVGVTQLISLTEEPFSPALAASAGIEGHAFPMPDMHPPTLEQGIALCERIDGLLARGEVVAVHCRAGLGRTGTVLACYWLWLGRGRLSAVKALEDVRRLEPGWVQSASQVEFLQEFSVYVATAALASNAETKSLPALEEALG